MGRLTLWVVATMALVLLAQVIAAKVNSWLIGFVGAGIAALLAMALLTSVSSAKIARRS
jgi:ascorbate-specific PTS system EIIC-type component UlaA